MRVCARSDCSSPAAAILTYDRIAQTAYLFAVDDDASRTPGDLCDRHLRRLVLPRSWCLDDRRETATVPDTAPEPKRKKLRAVRTDSPEPNVVGPSVPRSIKKAASSKRKWAEVGPSLFDPQSSDTAIVAEIAEVDTGNADERVDREPVWMPRFGPDTELDDVLDAKTPLLKRAFGGS